MPTYELDPDCVAVIGRMEAWQRRLEAKIDLMLTKTDALLKAAEANEVRDASHGGQEDSGTKAAGDT